MPASRPGHRSSICGPWIAGRTRAAGSVRCRRPRRAFCVHRPPLPPRRLIRTAATDLSPDGHARSGRSPAPERSRRPPRWWLVSRGARHRCRGVVRIALGCRRCRARRRRCAATARRPLGSRRSTVPRTQHRRSLCRTACRRRAALSGAGRRATRRPAGRATGGSRGRPVRTSTTERSGAVTRRWPPSPWNAPVVARCPRHDRPVRGARIGVPGYIRRARGSSARLADNSVTSPASPQPGSAPCDERCPLCIPTRTRPLGAASCDAVPSACSAALEPVARNLGQRTIRSAARRWPG